MKSKKTAVLGVLTAFAFGLSYLEYCIPFDAVGIPGFKPGFANLAVMAALYLFGWREAVSVSLVRLLLVWFFFGNMNAFFYAVAGAFLSLLVMTILKKTDFFGKVGVSLAGGVCHNLAQLAVASLLTQTAAVWGYCPVLLVFGTVTGAVNGFLISAVLKIKIKNLL